MTFEEKIGALCMRRRFGMRPGLERMNTLMERLGHPERDFVAVHIAGTNGKGSVAAVTASVLSACGFGKIGRYTSPHLVYFNERICIDGVPVSDEILESAYDELEKALSIPAGDEGNPSFFECVTALAFLVFRQNNVKIAVIETGLGGRLDATNVVLPVVSVITSIGLEHCEYLGNTIEAIAGEKAGIIKDGRPVVLGGGVTDEAREVIETVARSHKSPVIDCSVSLSTSTLKGGLESSVAFDDSFRSVSKTRFALSGSFQRENLITAINAVEVFAQVTGLPVSDDAFKAGIANVEWPCRFQVVSENPVVIVDGAHNPPAANALRDAMKKRKSNKPVALVAGFCDDKDCLTALKTINSLFKCAFAVEIPSPRTLPADKMALKMRSAGFREVSVFPDWRNGVEEARKWASDNDGEVVVCGSLFLAGAVADYFGALPWKSGVKTSNEFLKPSPSPSPESKS